MLGFTQHKLAELIGVSVQQFSKYEQGHTRMSAGRLFQIAAALGTTVGDLLADIDPGEAPPSAGQVEQFELVRNVATLPPKVQRTVCALVQALARTARSELPNEGRP